jgi:hypothetical protein
MALEFAGRGVPMTAPGFAACAETLGVHAPEVWAILTVETRGCGFLPDRRPLILFERHIFHRETAGRHDAVAPEISQPGMGGYGGGGARQYERLAQALAFDRRAALRSASWGIGQVMGFNAERAGFADAEAMVAAMSDTEDVQLRAMVGEIVTGNLHRSLRAHDWTSFARGYNGANFAVNQYDTRRAAAYQRFALGPLPDLTVRAAQMSLMYVGFDPGPVDGMLGRRTRSAVVDFQQKEALAASGNLDDATLERLRSRTALP